MHVCRERLRVTHASSRRVAPCILRSRATASIDAINLHVMRVSDTLSGAGKRSVQRQDGGAMPSRSDKCDHLRRCRCYFRSQNGRQRRPHDTAAAYASLQQCARARAARDDRHNRHTLSILKHEHGSLRSGLVVPRRRRSQALPRLLAALSASVLVALRSQKPMRSDLEGRVVPSALPGVGAI